MKKLIIWILTLCMVLGLVPTVYADDGDTLQLGKETVQLLQAQVNYGGYMHTAQVMRTQDGTVLAPLQWMTEYGMLKSKEFQGVKLYYKPGQEQDQNFAKRWTIMPQTRSYMVSWYFDTDMFSHFVIHADDCSLSFATQLIACPTEEGRQALLDQYFSQTGTKVKRSGSNYMPIHKGKFSKMLSYGDDYWVPVSELLALLELQGAVSEDSGVLCLKPSQMTLFDVLYEHSDEIEDLLFDSDNVIGSDFMAGTGYTVALFSGEIYNLNPNLGREIDYKEIFTSYLQDNEVYLSTFNAENDSKSRYYRKVAENFKGIKTLCEISAEGHKPIYDMFLESVTNPEFYYKFFEPAKKAGTAIEIAANVLPYIEAFANQVEDHRLMLDAVYDYKADTKWPSYIASQAVEKIYEDEANLAVAGTVDMTRKLVAEKLGEELYKKAFGGWYYAIEITKVLCKEDYEYVVNSSKINLVSNTVQYAYDMYENRLVNRQFKESGINNIRLCLMMSLVGSRHAYKTYYKGDMMKEYMDDIDKILSKLYEVGTSREENTVTICQERLTQYKEDIPKLQLVRNDPVVLAETGMLLQAIGNNNWVQTGWRLQDSDKDEQAELSILAMLGSDLKLISIDVDRETVSITPGKTSDVPKYNNLEILLDEQMVYGDAAAHLAALDAHFADRSGLVKALCCDVNGDGTEDRIFAFRGAAGYWDRDSANPLNFPEDALTLLVAEHYPEGAKLRFYFDPDFKGTGNTCAFADGELLIDGWAYSYYEKVGAPFRKIGLVQLQSLYSYLTGEIKPWEQARVDISYPDDSNRRKMDLWVDGVKLYVHADLDDGNVIYHEIQADPQGKAVPIIADVTTDNSAKQIIEALSLVSWDGHESVPFSDNLSAVMGPYPLMGGDEEAYECSVLWQMPDGKVYQLTMQLHEESLDASPYHLTITSTEKPKVALSELLLKSPEQVAGMLSGYSEFTASTGDAIYGEGYISDAFVEVTYEPYDGGFRAELVEIMFGEDTISVFPELDSTATAEEAKDFLQPNMDWDLKESKSDGDRDLYYTTNFFYDEDRQVFWYATMITAYTWTAEDGYSEGAFGGLELMYSAEKDDSKMSWYWTLYG